MIDREYKIKIGIAADTSGAKDATDALKQSAEAVNDDGKKTEENAKKTSFLNLKKTELKKITRELAHEFPIAGMAAKAMLNPIMFTLTASIGVFAKAKEALAKWNEELDAAGEAAAKPVKAHRDLADEAITTGQAFAGLAEHFRTTKTESDHLKNALDDQIEKLRTLQETQAEVDSYTKANEITKIHKDMKLRELDPLKRAGISATEGAQKLADVEAKYEEIGRQRKEDNAARELELQKKGLADQLAAKERAKAAETAATEKKVAAALKLKEVETKTGSFERTGPDMKSAAEREAEAELDKVQKWAEERRKYNKDIGGPVYSFSKGIQTSADRDAEVNDRVSSAQRALEAARTESAKFGPDLKRATLEKEASDLEAARAAKATDAATGNIDQYDKGVISADTKLKAVRQQNEILRPITAGTRQMETDMRNPTSAIGVWE